MSAESPAIHLIFFIVATSIAVGAATVLGSMVLTIAQGVDARADAMERALATDFLVINDPGRVSVNPTLFYAKNIGARIIEPTTITILFDGRYVNYTQAIQNGAPRWAPGDVVTYTIPVNELTVASGDHTAILVAEGGSRDVFRFRST